MKPFIMRLGMLIVGLAGAGMAMAGSEICPPPCEPGFKYIQVVEYHECDQVCCKRVPDVRKKWVYCDKPDHFCLPKCRLIGGCRKDGCGDDSCQASCGESCGECTIHCKGQLYKKQVECVHGTKCVLEHVKTVVPCTVWKKVPCGPTENVAVPLTAVPSPLPSRPVDASAD